MSFSEFQQVAQHDYQEKLVMIHVHISKKSFICWKLKMKRIGYYLKPSRSVPA